MGLNDTEHIIHTHYVIIITITIIIIIIIIIITIIISISKIFASDITDLFDKSKYHQV